jgi:hypothetical protein
LPTCRGAELTPGSRRVRFSVDVKNLSIKTIKAVEWTFTLKDSVRKITYDKFEFRSEKEIKPDATKRLTKRFDYHRVPDYVQASADITKIEYSDGSAWIETKKK